MNEKEIKVKVCGMTDPENIRALAALNIDMIGFIFYPASPRYAGRLSRDIINQIPGRISKVGVFVDESPGMLFPKVEKYQLNLVQLHGDETPEYCWRIKREVPGIKIIKAFGVKDDLDLDFLASYVEAADLFLFDTYTEKYGGSGITFNRNILSHYSLEIPFLLSGGIDENILDELQKMNLPQLYALDINSRFETAPGIKDIPRIKNFISKIKS